MRLLPRRGSLFFFFNDTATTEIYTLSLHDALPIWWVESAAQSCSRFVTSIFTVRVESGWMTVVSPRRGSIGDLAPKSANTVRASITNESAGAPRAGTAGTRKSVPRVIWDESLMNFGNATRNRLCADGTPPTARVESSGAGGGLNTKLANPAPRVPGVRATPPGVAPESTRMYHCSTGPKLPLPSARLASVSAAMRMPYADRKSVV